MSAHLPDSKSRELLLKNTDKINYYKSKLRVFAVPCHRVKRHPILSVFSNASAAAL